MTITTEKITTPDIIGLISRAYLVPDVGDILSMSPTGLWDGLDSKKAVAEGYIVTNEA